MTADRDTPLPGVELASLPREQVGPFLILGVPKDADAETIEAHWAQRVLWARQGKSRIPLEDIHWARQVLRDPERRLIADAASLNPDTTGNDLRRLAQSFHLDPPRPAWEPIEPELPVGPEMEVPDPTEVQSRLPAPDVPLKLPAVAGWLERFARAPIDPWSVTLPPPDPPQESAG